MQQRTLGKTGLPISALTLGGEGIGMVWGPTTDEEGIATVKAAVASGITMLDGALTGGSGGARWPRITSGDYVAIALTCVATREWRVLRSRKGRPC